MPPSECPQATVVLG